MIPRETCLDTARRLIAGDRAQAYGSLAGNAGKVSELLETLGLTGTPADYPLTMIAVKLARLAQNPDHLDSWTDIAGYAALGYELAEPNPSVITITMDDGQPINAREDRRP